MVEAGHVAPPHPWIPAWEIAAGPILTAWIAAGRSSSDVGFPDATAIAITGPGVPAGSLSQRFRDGSIVYNPNLGAFSVKNRYQLDEAYQKHGGPVGFSSSPNAALGFPIGNETFTGLNDVYQEFENGIIVNPLHAAPSMIFPRVFTNGTFYVGELNSSGDDCFLDLCPGLEAKWHIYVDQVTPTGTVPLYPPGLFYGNGQNRMMYANDTHTLVPKFKHDLTIKVTYGGSDDDTIGANDVFPDVAYTYTIDNLWGRINHLGDPLSNVHDIKDSEGETLRAMWEIRSNLPYDRSSLLSSEWWSFQNFFTPTVSWETMSSTFYDIEPSGIQPFSKLFYELVFSGIGAGGNCFGMDLEAIYAQKRRSPQAEPIFQYFADTQSGAQLNAAV